MAAHITKGGACGGVLELVEQSAGSGGDLLGGPDDTLSERVSDRFVKKNDRMPLCVGFRRNYLGEWEVLGVTLASRLTSAFTTRT